MALAPPCQRVRVPLWERVEQVGDVERLWVSVALAGRPMYSAVVHHVDGILVDSGPGIARRAVERFLARRPLRAVLTTHLHEDHVGNHEILPRDVPVHAPEATVALLERGPPPIPRYRLLTWGGHGPAPGARVVGEVVETPKRRFRVFATPGHSEDHVSFLDEGASALYTGDAYLGKPRVARLEEDVHTQIESLRRIAEIDAQAIFPGHGPAVQRPRQKILDTIEHMEGLARRAWALADKGLTRRQIAREMFGPEPFITWFSLGEFSAVNLVENLLRRRP